MGAGRRKHRTGAIAWALLLILPLAACRGRAGPKGPPLVLGMPRMVALGLVDIAERHGEFARQGVKVEQRFLPAGRDALEELLDGKLDLAVAYSTPLVRAAAEHPRLRILTLLYHATHNTVVVARRDRGIRFAEDLRGRRIGVPADTSAAFFLETLLAFSGLSPGEVTEVNLDPEAGPGALARGEVDALAIWYPLARRAREALPAGDAVEITSDVYMDAAMLVVREELLRTRPAEVAALVRGLSAAERLAQDRPAQAFAALRAAHPNMREEDLRADWARGRPGLGLTNLLLAVLERESRWGLRARGSLAPPLDFREFFAPGPLAAADPEAVTVHQALPPPVEEGESP